MVPAQSSFANGRSGFKDSGTPMGLLPTARARVGTSVAFTIALFDCPLLFFARACTGFSAGGSSCSDSRSLSELCPSAVCDSESSASSSSACERILGRAASRSAKQGRAYEEGKLGWRFVLRAFRWPGDLFGHFACVGVWGSKAVSAFYFRPEKEFFNPPNGLPGNRRRAPPPSPKCRSFRLSTSAHRARHWQNTRRRLG